MADRFLDDELLELDELKPCRSLGCTEVIGRMDEYQVAVDGVVVAGFCRACFERLTDA